MNPQVPLSSGTDVVDFLKNQHDLVKSALARVLSTRGEQRQKAFLELRQMITSHEAAEQEIVHPAARTAFPNGEAVVTERLKEEAAASAALQRLATLDVDSTEFVEKFRELQGNVLAHASREEHEEFNGLTLATDERRLEQMIAAVRSAEARAATRLQAQEKSTAPQRRTIDALGQRPRSLSNLRGVPR